MMRKVPIPQPLLLYKQEKDNTCWAATARTLYHYATGMQISENEFIEKTRGFQYGACIKDGAMCNQPENVLNVHRLLRDYFKLDCHVYTYPNVFDNKVIELIKSDIPFVVNLSFPNRTVGHSYLSYQGTCVSRKQNRYICETYFLTLFDPSNKTSSVKLREQIIDNVTSILYVIKR